MSYGGIFGVRFFPRFSPEIGVDASAVRFGNAGLFIEASLDVIPIFCKELLSKRPPFLLPRGEGGRKDRMRAAAR
jgi:hypothetical protein